METVYFLCGNYNNENYVYAIKKDESDWYYFEEKHSLLDSHIFLPSSLKDKISHLKTVTTVTISLNAEQLLHYVNEGKFVFMGRELATCKLGLGKNFVDTSEAFIIRSFLFRHSTFWCNSESKSSIISEQKRKVNNHSQY